MQRPLRQAVHRGELRAIPENLFESEFFGYKKGAFTGALADRKGCLDRADGGTLFLDELGELSLSAQTKLLRAIEGQGFTPVGGPTCTSPTSASSPPPTAIWPNGSPRGRCARTSSTASTSSRSTCPPAPAQGGHPPAHRVLPQRLSPRRGISPPSTARSCRRSCSTTGRATSASCTIRCTVI